MSDTHPPLWTGSKWRQARPHDICYDILAIWQEVWDGSHRIWEFELVHLHHPADYAVLNKSDTAVGFYCEDVLGPGSGKAKGLLVRLLTLVRKCRGDCWHPIEQFKPRGKACENDIKNECGISYLGHELPGTSHPVCLHPALW